MKALFLGVVTGLGSVLAAEYPAQKINRIDAVHFGQPMAEVEHMFEKKAVPESDGISRPDKDFVLAVDGVHFDFDSGKLDGINFESDFDYKIVLAAFPEPWRNLDPIGALRIKKGMKKPEFLAYFKAWEERAQRLGIRRNDGNELLKDDEYSVSITEDELMDMIHVGFGPERSTGKGGSWGSALTVSFVTKQLAPMYGRKAGSLDSISFFCDEFNTHARHQGSGGSPEPKHETSTEASTGRHQP